MQAAKVDKLTGANEGTQARAGDEPHRLQKRIVVQEVAGEKLIALRSDVERASDVGKGGDADRISDNRYSIFKVPQQLSVPTDRSK